MKIIQTPSLDLLIKVPEGTKTLTIEGFQSDVPLIIEHPPLDQVTIKNCIFGGSPTWLGTFISFFGTWRFRWIHRKFHSILYRTVPLPEGVSAWIEFRPIS